MTIPFNAKSTPTLITGSVSMTYDSGPGDVLVASSQGEPSKLGDLLLWADRPFEFSVGPESGSPTGTFTFGPSEVSYRATLDVAAGGVLSMQRFTIGSNPYAALLNLANAKPIWWQESGQVYSFDVDLTLEALADGGGPGKDLIVSSQSGLLFQVAHRPAGVRFMVGSDLALTIGPLASSFAKDLYVRKLEAHSYGVQIPQVAAMPTGSSGVVGEIRAVDDGTNVYLAVKTGITTWKRTVNF